ncbi:unnamed protein product [Choristocarpus tenellus]
MSELEVAVRAAMVGGGHSRALARASLVHSAEESSRQGEGEALLELLSRDMMRIMKVNAQLLKGLQECSKLGPPPRRRRMPNTPKIRALRREHECLRARLERLEIRASAREKRMTKNS